MLKKRILAALLAMCMLTIMMPMALAATITTPTGLQWVMQAGTIDQVFTDSSYGSADLSVYPGDMLWNRVSNGTNSYYVELLKDGAVVDSSRHNFSAMDISPQLSIGMFREAPRESGNYTFTVKVLGNGAGLDDSSVATSPVWTYSAPAAQLSTPTNLRWDGSTARWDAVPAAGSYTIEWYYSETADGTYKPAGYTTEWIPTSIDLESWVVAEHGDGYYKFAIRALSNDVTTYRTGELSALSAAYSTTTGTTNPDTPDVPDAPTNVTTSLESILNGLGENPSAAEIQSAVSQVKSLDIQELKLAMSADQDNTGINETIKELESKTGVSVSAAVDDGVALDASEISMTGAALNANGNNITLAISKPDREMIVPGAYANTIQFDFQLDGAENVDELAVPIKISMPIPAGIDPQNLRILHYDASGEIDEVLMPHVYQQDSAWYASFVVTHFSTFVFANEGESGGSNANDSPANYSIAAETNGNGTIDVSTTRAEQGDTVTITVAPDEGHELDTLVVRDRNDNEVTIQRESDTQYTFVMPASQVVVEAIFTETASESDPSTTMPFADVNTTDWYYDAVAFVYQNGMMNGTSSSLFDPNNTTTRAMIVTILHRLEGEPDATASNFTDVASNIYYADAVAWAQANEIVNGTSETTFSPDDPITREQMAAILYRYAQFKSYDTTASTSLSVYSDSSQISSYATTAMQWANAEGLITGDTATTINPSGNATRAEVATILMRFVENIA